LPLFIHFLQNREKTTLKLRYLLLTFFIFLFGCSDAPIYKTNNLKEIPKCVNAISLFKEDIEVARDFFEVSENCEHELLIEPHRTHNCNNPRVKSLGSDFDGYVSIKIYKDEKLLFRSQTDFKGDDYIPHLRRLLKDVKK
jgi:hypothetical protein